MIGADEGDGVDMIGAGEGDGADMIGVNCLRELQRR